MSDRASEEGEGASPAPSELTEVRVTFTGTAGELWPIVLVNLVLNIITLSFYRFWARTSVRRYLWDRTLINDEPLEYTGTGKELFLGFLLVLGVIFLPLAVALIAVQIFFGPETFTAITGLLYFPLLFLLGAAVYRAWGYRLSRTMWRGIRFGLTGSWVKYGFKFVGFLLLTVMSYGWAYPWMVMRLSDQEMNNTWIGGEKFDFKGSASSLYGRFTAVWFGGILGIFVLFALIFTVVAVLAAAGTSDAEDPVASVGPALVILPILLYVVFIFYFVLLQSFFTARYLSVLMASLSLKNLSFTLNATAWSYAGLEIVNMLITIVTLGFGVPFAQMRRFRYFCDRLSIQGEIDLAAIEQSALEGPSIGEGLADAFDIGAI